MTQQPLLPASELEKAETACRRIFPNAAPRAGIILGSGWGPAIVGFTELASCSTGDIAGLGRPTVAGHSGRIILAECAGIQTLVFQGRRHWYEGDGWLPVAIPVYLLKKLGARAVLLTNSAGGIRADLEPGALALIRDHLNLMGANPLQGPHQPVWGPRFPDLSRVYHPEWNRLLADAATVRGIPLTTGIYAALPGPTYETPAEIRMLAALGADMVGMSTVPEAILAHAAGLAVAGLSCITNTAAGLTDVPPNHADVLARLAEAQARLAALLETAWTRLAASPILQGEPP